MKMYQTPKITHYIKDMAKKLEVGQIKAVHGEGATTDTEGTTFVFFIIRETDEVIKSLGKTPNIEAIAGMINVHIRNQQVWCVPTLIRFSRKPEQTYYFEYNLADPESFSTYAALGKKQQVDFLFCGDTQEKVISAELFLFNDHVTENLKIAKEKTNFDWNVETYNAAKLVINDAPKNELWDIFLQHGSLLELSQNKY